MQIRGRSIYLWSNIALTYFYRRSAKGDDALYQKLSDEQFDREIFDPPRSTAKLRERLDDLASPSMIALIFAFASFALSPLLIVLGLWGAPFYWLGWYFVTLIGVFALRIEIARRDCFKFKKLSTEDDRTKFSFSSFGLIGVTDFLIAIPISLSFSLVVLPIY